MSAQLHEITRQANESEATARQFDEPTWPEPIDLFETNPVPDFPGEVMPEDCQRWADDVSRATGFDRGAYLFLLLAHAGCLIDHRTRVKVNDRWSEPAFHWAAIVDSSGGGKSPVLSAAGKFANQIYDDLMRESKRQFAEWKKSAIDTSDDADDRPTIRQRSVDNTTVEALTEAESECAEGVTIVADELTGWLGSMDAYSTAGANKDRPEYLKAHSGIYNKRVNRVKGSHEIEHWSAGVIGAIQPGMLAQQFSRAKGGGSSDGLIQRFMVYKMQPAGDSDLLAQSSPMVDGAVGSLFNEIREICESGPKRYRLTTDAVQVLQQYDNDRRRMTSNSAGVRFGEHLGKFSSFILRVALTLHVLHEPHNEDVSAQTMEKAHKVMGVLYWHSEAVYALLDKEAGDAISLVRSAGETILGNGWAQFTRSDLTKQATGWTSGTDEKQSESAIRRLIELGWIADVTDQQPKRRGPKSAGVFEVNPEVHQRFEAQASRIATQRREQVETIRKFAADRRSGNS